MKKSVAFVCVHNSCRSQIAEALAKKYGSDLLEIYSAGTETKPQINQDAVRLMKEIYDIDMEETQRSKVLDEIPKVNYLVTMGCNVMCPVQPYTDWEEDWGLEDPTGKSDDEFRKTISIIDSKVKDFIERVKNEKN